MEKKILGGHFNLDKYEMVYCPVCKGSGKLSNGAEGGLFARLAEFGLVSPSRMAETPRLQAKFLLR